MTSSSLLRRLIREIILEDLGASASGTDPSSADGFYAYDLERGTDIRALWYASPGREPGTDGDPYRPGDAAAWVGFEDGAGNPEEPEPE